MIQILFSMVLISVEMHKRKMKKANRENLNVDRQFFKDVIHIFDVTLFNLVAGPIPIYRKNCNTFALFLFSNSPSQTIN